MPRLHVLITIIFLSLVLGFPRAAHADVNDFTVTNFTANYYLGTGDRQGTLKVEEQLNINFTDYNHGILRALPERYSDQSLYLDVRSVERDGAKEPYTTYTSNGNKVLKIGDAIHTITGTHHYSISYQVENVIRFAADGNELIWNTSGTEWTQPFITETARLHVPKSLADKQMNIRCYTGQYKSDAHDCTVITRGADTEFITSRVLLAGETMTFGVNFPSGTFAPPTAVDWWRDNGLKLAAVVIPATVAFVVAYRRWFRDGKDIKGKGTIIPEYGPPDGMSPALADTVLHYQLTNAGISATVIDLAIKRNLKIVESEDGGLLGIGKHKVYTFVKLEQPTMPLAPHEQMIFDGLFTGRSSVTTTDLKSKFYNTITQVKAELDKKLLEGKFVPRSQMSTYLTFWGWIIAFGVVLAIFSTFYPYISTGCGVGIAIFILFTLIMPKRTQLGADAKDRLEGLKLYMNTVDKDRLAMMQSVDAPYQQSSAEPEKTVVLFEKLLPYAIILGVEKSWANQFENIYNTPPDWYRGNWTAFNAGYLVGSLTDSISAMNTSFAAPSSGAGGDGFSAGGGGGGGGGGW